MYLCSALIYRQFFLWKLPLPSVPCISLNWFVPGVSDIYIQTFTIGIVSMVLSITTVALKCKWIIWLLKFGTLKGSVRGNLSNYTYIYTKNDWNTSVQSQQLHCAVIKEVISNPK